MQNGTLSIINNACEAKLELKSGELTNHVGCAYDCWEQRVKHMTHLNTNQKAQLMRDVLTELHQLGFKW